MTWAATILTLYPEMFPGPLGLSLAGKAFQRGDWRLDAVDLRRFTKDRHQTVDDTPFGGGAGMVMRPDIVARALDATMPEGDDRPRLFLTPRGRPLGQARVQALAEGPGVVLLCGRYEGIDQRVVTDAATRMPVLELSIGDYVLAGGEVAAMVIIEAVTRLLPEVLGNPESAEDDSFSGSLTELVEAPSYTRPPVYRGLAVPAVLVSGDHAAVAAYRREESRRRTAANRPDLLIE